MGCEETCRGRDHYDPFEEWKKFHLTECPSFQWLGRIPERRNYHPPETPKRVVTERVFGTTAQILQAIQDDQIMDVDYDKTRHRSGRYSWIPNEGKLK
jgi:hypothetical protein